MRQTGSVLPYVLAIMMTLMLSGQYVFNAYKTANESTRLQNTTDAAAYSVAAVYAQNYNYVALSNRALVANQITMAQVVTMVSWARMLGTFSTTINDIGQYIPYVSTVTNYVEQVGANIQQVVENIAPTLTQIIQTYIVAVTALQAGAVPSVALIAQEVLKEVVEKNDPDIDYSLASISLVGGSIAHLSELYGQNDCKDQADKVRESGTNAGNKETIARCRQFRNVTLASRDGFTENRTYRFKLPGMPDTIFLPGVAAELVAGAPVFSELTLERSGGTTMGGDTPGVQNATPFTTWTAIDAISLHASTEYIDPFRGVRSTRHREQVKLGVGHAYVGNECSRCHHLVHEGTPYWNKNSRGSACTDPDRNRGYGGGSKSMNRGAFVLMDVLSLDCQSLSDDYGESLNDDDNVGLTDFYNLNSEGYVEEKDHLMVYLRKEREKVKTASATMGSSSDASKLDRYSGAESNAFHGSAAASAYFRRSNDRWMLPSAKRLDGRLEFGNTYNPFWEARLTKLSAGQKTTLKVMKAMR